MKILHSSLLLLLCFLFAAALSHANEQVATSQEECADCTQNSAILKHIKGHFKKPHPPYHPPEDVDEPLPFTHDPLPFGFKKPFPLTKPLPLKKPLPKPKVPPHPHIPVDESLPFKHGPFKKPLPKYKPPHKPPLDEDEPQPENHKPIPKEEPHPENGKPIPKEEPHPPVDESLPFVHGAKPKFWKKPIPFVKVPHKPVMKHPPQDEVQTAEEP